MKILLITHASFEKPGSIDDWAYNQGHHVFELQTYNGQKIPDINDFDLIIVLGGPQSPMRLDNYPYLQAEIELIKEAILLNKKILGICLGAQLIGEALGAATSKSPEREVGVFPVKLTAAAADDPVFRHFPQQFDVMHWHNDMAGLPDKAVLLASSPGCPNQVFKYKERVYAIQCHFEFTAEHVREIADISKAYLQQHQDEKYVMQYVELQSINCDENNKRIAFLLDYLANLD